MLARATSLRCAHDFNCFLIKYAKLHIISDTQEIKMSTSINEICLNYIILNGYIDMINQLNPLWSFSFQWSLIFDSGDGVLYRFCQYKYMYKSNAYTVSFYIICLLLEQYKSSDIQQYIDSIHVYTIKTREFKWKYKKRTDLLINQIFNLKVIEN